MNPLLGGLALRIRTPALIAVFCTGMSLGVTTPSLAQDAQPTAQQIFETGMELYQAGQLEEAQKVFRDQNLDPLQLPREQRVAYYNAISEIEQTLEGVENPTPLPQPVAGVEGNGAAEAATPTATAQIAQADLLIDDAPADAIALYQAAMGSDDITAAQRATAQARIAQATRAMNSDKAAARRMIALANQDLIAGDLDAAERKLETVQGSDADLDWWDADDIDNKLALIGQVRAARAAADEAERMAQAEADNQPQPQPQGNGDAEVDPALAQARAELQEKEAELAAMRRKLAERDAEEQVGQRGPGQSDLISQARVQIANDKEAEADEALRNGQLNLAVELYREAALLSPDDQELAAKLTDAQNALNQQLRPLDPGTTFTQQMSIRAQEARARYENAMEQANTAFENKQWQAATDAVLQSRTVLNNFRNALTQTEYDEKIARSASLQNAILEQQRFDAAEEQRRVAIDREREERDAAVRAEREQREEIRRRIIAARDRQMQREYGAALNEVEAALQIDPHNEEAQTLKMLYEDIMIGIEGERLHRKLDLMRANQKLISDESLIPYDEIMVYPGDWPELTQLRLAGLDDNEGESEANRTAALALRRIVTINFDANSFSSVIDYIRDTTGANITVNWPALEIVGIDQDTLVTIRLNRIPAEQLLSLVLAQVSAEQFDDEKAGYSIKDGVIVISTRADLKTETDTRVYDIRDLLVEVPNFTNAPNFDVNDALSNTNSGGSNQGGGGGGGGGGRGGGGGGLFGDSQDDAEEESLTRRELIDQITQLIEDTVGDPNEWLDQESTLRELNGNLIVKTTSTNHRDILGLLGRLRETRAIQISVEGRFLLVEEHFLEEFGVDLDLSFDPNDDNWSPINFDQGTAAQQVGGNNGIAQRVTNSLTPGAFLPGSAGVPTSAALGVSYLDDIQADLLITATLASQNSISLTAPRITFFNGQRAYVMVATQITFISDLEPIPNSPGFDPTLSVTQSGVILDVQGTISADRRYVTMTLRPSLANVTQPIRTIPQTTAPIDLDGDGLFDGPGEQGGSAFVEAPEVEITQVRSTVSIPDRGTLLAGGQRLVGEAEVEAGVPVLSKIPYLNRLFTNTSTVKDERTLLVLIRPTIIIQSEQEDLLFPGLNDDANSFNIGR